MVVPVAQNEVTNAGERANPQCRWASNLSVKFLALLLEVSFLFPRIVGDAHVEWICTPFSTSTHKHPGTGGVVRWSTIIRC
mmetsp:Transcript_17583/g.47943  ORF Transcript_17583/g.47943 Transcript_17583/m.47943 type:complete len:81 (+) Transcript_17583:1074-1316(+)